MTIQIPYRKSILQKELMAQLFESGALSDKCNVINDLEERIASWTGVRYALLTTTSTSALHIAMCALNLKRGDKVLCPVNSYANLPEVVRYFDAEPVFVDTISRSYSIDPDKLEEVAEKIKGKKLRAEQICEAVKTIAKTHR